ncbi:MAG TPA: DNA methyltransferase [Bryobacteraceae bacterium]|nr:DNA methyltransferase [Bryobacteraceae bacterium]
MNSADMLNRVTRGDCLDVMKELPSRSVDFILTDPPYLVRYLDRSGRSVKNDDNAEWLDPAFAQMHRVLKEGRFCVSFYAWNKVERFAAAWKAAGFGIAGHVVFPKKYASSSRFMKYQHEQAYLLMKGNGALPASPPPDVIAWTYTGNKLHPTQKPVGIFTPLIEAFTRPGDVVLDPFCGSGSTLVAARDMGRRFVGIELDPVHHLTASARLQDQPIAVSKFGGASPSPEARARPADAQALPAGGARAFANFRPTKGGHLQL